jgi:hypothetical protein
MATFFKKKNNARSTLTANIDAVTTSIPVADATRFPSEFPYILSIWDKARYPNPADDPKVEIVVVNSASGNTLSVTRSVDDTTANAHSSGNAIEMLITVATFKEIEDAINSTPGLVSYKKFVFTATQGQTIFTFADEPIEVLSLAKNRFVLCETEDYTISHSTLTLLEGADDGDKIFGIYIY